jgi:excisionase family DNA binding protein
LASLAPGSTCKAPAYLAVSEQTLSRYVKENTAPPSVKVGNGRRFHRSDLDAWIRAGGILAFKKAQGADANSKSIPRAKTKSRFKDSVGFEPVSNHKHMPPSAKSDECTINGRKQS